MSNQSLTMSSEAGPQVHSVTCCVVLKPSSSVSESVLAMSYQSKKRKYGEKS